MSKKNKVVDTPGQSEWLPLFLDFTSNLTVDSKESGVGPLNLYGSQMRFLAEIIEGLERDVHTFVNLKAMQLGCCLHPDHRVLTADLRWKKISDLKIGDELVATDEEPPGGHGRDRKMRTSRVEAIREVHERAVKFTFDDGRQLTATPEHRFLSRQRGGKSSQWRRVDKTVVGDSIRWITHPWDDANSYEDGWFGGILDGEGSMRQKDRAGVECCVCQVQGDVLDRAHAYVNDRGYSDRLEIDDKHKVVNKTGSISKLGTKPVHKIVISQMQELFRLIGQARPSRFLKKRWWEGKSLPGKKTGIGYSEVTAIDHLPEQRMIDLQTSTKTFIVEGFVSHNSTIALAVDLFWLAVHPGMQGVLVTDTDGNRQKFRIILKRFIASLPKSYAIEIAKGGDNREHMVFENGSVLDFIVAGTRATSTEVGRSRAYNFAHLTETSNYGTIEGVVSLLDRLAEKHPHRLYLIESTAKGYNLFYKLWCQARNNPDTQKAFFIGWWAKDDYSIDTDNPLFEKYWDGTVTQEEQARVNEVWERYGYRITPNQIAWYRWKGDVSAEASLMDQNFPWTEDDAFLNTGQSFFPTKPAVAMVAQLEHNPPPFLGYRYEFGTKFNDTKIEKVQTAEDAHLKIYEQPSDNGWYAMGVDPAYGRSENKDNSVIEVYRCYADRFVQVAEFATHEIQNFQVAWVMAHMAGIYQNMMMIVEITGPGDAVILEVGHLKQLYDGGLIKLEADGEITDIFGNARWFMYHRSDSPGAGYVFNFKTSLDSKISLLEEFNGSFVTGALEIRSILCAMEIQSMVRRGFVIEPSLDDQKDDRVMGSAFAHRAWSQWIRPGMITRNETWARVTEAEAAGAEGDHDNLVSHIISGFFQGKADEREEDEIQSAWGEDGESEWDDDDD